MTHEERSCHGHEKTEQIGLLRVQSAAAALQQQVEQQLRGYLGEFSLADAGAGMTASRGVRPAMDRKCSTADNYRPKPLHRGLLTWE
ncbi:hypothetical protein ACFUNF_18605 [Streptomyces sp. NPDC057291]|uniref:hypothetical protein n=1 Tax=Streptomyces sp. NPDC057291 TaxID=3346087 RepID=UPI0036458905